MLITVFTPTYNRAHLLPRLYDSLCKQTFKDFEWLIVDDGSVDDTTSVVDQLIIDNGQLIIRYIYQENGGKHRAINRGVKEARGELFFIVDSDDMLFPNSLDKIVQEYEIIKTDSSFCGVSGMRGYSSQLKIGTKRVFGHLDCTILESSYKYHLYGDKAEVIRTDVMKQFPFPEFDNEKFCPEALIWNRISKYYKIRYFDEIIYLCEYLPDGLTSKISRLLEKNIKYTMLAYKEMNEYVDAPLWFKIRAAINYYRYTLFRSFSQSPEFKLNLKWIWIFPFGMLARIIKG